MFKTIFLSIFLIFILSENSFSKFKTNTFARADDGDWVTISGKVTLARPDYFILDKGNKKIMVEMDDWDWYKEGYKILTGDKVVVSGKVDEDFLEKRKVEASTVFVKSRNVFYFASSDDEVNPYIYGLSRDFSQLTDGLKIEVFGHVGKIDGREFTLHTNFKKINIDTSDMIYNPLDKEGMSKINLGDHVKVYGEIEDNIFSDDEIKANWVITLRKQ